MAIATSSPIDPVASPTRVESVDALRGLTILLMVFVNDLGPAAPAWLHHIRPGDADGMTLADLVFPTFLFVVGIAIPLAFERARGLGRSLLSQLGHIFFRTVALLFMGVLVERDGDPDQTLPYGLWQLLAFVAVLAAWCVVPKSPGRGRTFALVAKGIGVVSLIALLAIFRVDPKPAEVPFWGTVPDWRWIRIGWWGILGLIGWAYLTASLIVLVVGRRREWLAGLMAILLVLHLAIKGPGLFAKVGDKAWLGPLKPYLATLQELVGQIGSYVGLGDAVGSLAAISVAGCLLGSILCRSSDVRTHGERLRWGVTFVVGLLVAGLVFDGFEGINKNAATPTWCLWSAALACVAWGLLYLAIDLAGWRRWSVIVRPAGANPIVAYFLHPIVVGAIELIGLESSVLGYRDSADPRVVVGGSLGMAMVVCLLTGLLGRLGLKVRL